LPRECFELQVLLRSAGSLVTVLDLVVVVVPVAHVLARLGERRAHDLEVAHARGRKLVARAEDALGILAGSEFDRARRVREQQLVASQAVLVLDDHGLAADHVGGPVQQQLRRDPAGQRAIEVLGLVVERVLHHHLRHHRAGGLVDIAVQRAV
jgi:hypothetical protein